MVLAVLSSFLRQSCLVFTNVTSALEVFKCYALYKYTFLADRTNGRAIATLLRLSSSSVVVVCDVMYCG